MAENLAKKPPSGTGEVRQTHAFAGKRAGFLRLGRLGAPQETLRHSRHRRRQAGQISLPISNRLYSRPHRYRTTVTGCP